MAPGEKATRRQTAILLAALVSLALVAFAVVTSEGDSGRQPVAAPLHPLAGDFVPDDLRLQECSDDPCFRQALGNIAYREGPSAAFELVERVYGDGGSAACHGAAHVIGAAALARYHGSVARTFAEGSPMCWSGYYHGVLERSLVHVESYEADALAEVARTLCRDDVARLTPWIAYQCLHGLGHGLMITTGLDLPRSLAVCRLLDSYWDRDACRGGVFMENIQPSYGAASRWFRADDPVYPCNVVARADKWRCYQMSTSRILPAVENSWERTAEVCSGVERGFVHVCFRSFGRDASSRSGRDPSAIVETCAVAKAAGGEADCIVGAAADVTANFASGEPAAELCEAVSAGLLESCYFGIGTVMGRFGRSPEEREADCRATVSAEAHVAACLAGGPSALPKA